MATGVALRKLEWPQLPQVDLTTEFHWLIHDDADATTDQQDKEADVRDQDTKAQDDEFQFASSLLSDLDCSPYKHLLQQRKEKRPPLSPAQRAAKKILKLKLELGSLDDEHDLSEYSQQQEQFLLGDSVDQDAAFRREFHENQPKQTTKQPASVTVPRARATSPSIHSSTSTANCRGSRLGQPPTFIKGITTSRSTSGSTSPSKLPSRSAAATGKKKLRPEFMEKRELRELHAKQQRLADWLAGDNSRETRFQEKRGKKHDADKTVVAYSIEIESRIHDAMESNRDKGLWGDPVASLIACEMTSESVFGGFTPTRRLAFSTAAPDLPPKYLNEPSEASSPVSKALQPGPGPDNLLSEHQGNLDDLIGSEDDGGSDRIEIPEDASSSLIHKRTLEIREEAQHLVLAGNIDDALATLQSGIKQLLFDFQENQDEIHARGFNFSQDAHHKATQVQLRYKARHRKRVRHIVFLQRVWRNYQVRSAFLDTKAYKHLNAKVIQRHYKTRYFHLCRTRAATRIQTCFRIFQEQKMRIYLHRACRLLVNEERKKREKIRRRQVLRKRLWVKLSSVLKLLWLWKSRFRALARIQSHWKGSLARMEYAKVLAGKCELEQARLARELEFVEPRLNGAMALFGKFLRGTRVGGELVRWQMKKPWLRFKRLRQGDWHGLEFRAKVQALHDVLILKYASQLGARLLRVVGLLLGVDAAIVNTIRQPMSDASAESLTALYGALLLTSGTSDTSDSAHGAMPVLPNQSKRSRIAKWLKKRQEQWMQGWQSLILRLSCSLLLLYWHAVLWPLSYVFTRRSATNKQHALSILAQQQRFALTKHLRHTFRQLDVIASSSKNRPNFACQHCFEAFATAHAWNLHLRECKRDHDEKFIEWEAVRSDIAFLSQQNPRLSTSSLLLSATTPLEFYLGFSTFESESDFVQRLRTEKWWSSRERALQILIDMAVCCGVSPNVVDNREATSLGLQGDGHQQQHVALDLFAYLLLPLRSHPKLHPLVIPQLHAFVDWAQPSVRSAPISEEKLFAALLLTKRRPLCLKLQCFVDIAARAVNCWWERAKTWARSSFSSSGSSSKYQGTHASAVVRPEA